MVKILGACAIGFSAVYFGVSLSADLARRAETVGALRDMLLSMRQKLSAWHMPLPALLRETAQEQIGGYTAFCVKAAAKLDRERRKPAERILTDCFRAEAPSGLPEEGRRIAFRVFATLGRLDPEQQLTVLDRAIGDLDSLETELRQDHRRRGRCYLALGICSGLAAAILLL